MLDSLVLYNFSTGFEFEVDNSNVFILRTCQRTLILTTAENYISSISDNAVRILRGLDAYKYLLEITCGLQSKLIGENEIVSQVKDAYRSYIKQENTNSTLLTILEKLFKDTKEVRTKYLIGLGQKTYASITRRKIYNQLKAQEVVIFGSGRLAEDLINQFKKKCKVILCARNTQRVQELTQKHQIESILWEDRQDTHSYPFLVNTIGTKELLFCDNYINQWNENRKKAFVDLSCPSPLHESSLNHNDISLLQDVLEEGALKEQEKLQKLNEAKEAMETIAKNRHLVFQKKKQKQMDYLTNV